MYVYVCSSAGYGQVASNTTLTQYKHPYMVCELIKLTRGVCREVYHVMLLLPKNCLVFWKRQPWVSLADVTLLIGVHKCLLNFWFKRVEDCYIRVSKFIETKSGVLLTFVQKEQK